MVGDFGAAEAGDIMQLKPGDVLQYLLSTSGDAIGQFRLEYCIRPGIWQAVRGANGSLVDSTGTVAVPLTSTIYSGQVTNETGRTAWYRWRAVTFDLDNSARVSWSILNMPQAAYWIDAKSLICYLVGDHEPVDGALGDGKGFAGGGSIYITNEASGDPKIWFNNGSASSPDWDVFG